MARDLAVMSWLIKRLYREMSKPRREVWVGLQRVGRGLLRRRKIAPSKAGKGALGHWWIAPAKAGRGVRQHRRIAPAKGARRAGGEATISSMPVKLCTA
jgi:hypothetical protein